MRRLMGMLAVTLVLATLALVMGCGGNSTGTSPGTSVGTAGKAPGTAYTVRYLLPDWPNGTTLWPQDLNGSGQIACNGTKSGTGPYQHAVLWANRVVTELGELAGSLISQATSINAAGDIAGKCDVNGWDCAVAWRAGAYGTPTDLHQALPGWKASEAWGINDSGGVVGMWTEEIQPPGGGYSYTYHGRYWSLSGGGSDIPNCDYAFDVNGPGQVTGRSGAVPAIWQDLSGGWQTFPLPLPSGYTIGYGEHINLAGHVAGRMTPGGGAWRAFLWNGSQVVDLGMLAGCEHAQAYGINDKDEVVGFAWHVKNPQYTYKAFIWRNGVMSDLGALAGTSVLHAWAINYSGQIAGDGPKGGLLLTPK